MLQSVHEKAQKWKQGEEEVVAAALDLMGQELGHQAMSHQHTCLSHFRSVDGLQKHTCCQSRTGEKASKSPRSLGSTRTHSCLESS